jgi:hypothetical protein
MAGAIIKVEGAARPSNLADPMASHIAAVHQFSDANVCDGNQNGRAEN